MNLFSKVKQMKQKRAPMRLEVVSNIQLSQNFQRVVVTGEALSKLSKTCEGQYIKLLFDAQGRSEVEGFSAGDRPSMRTYTIRRFDPDTLQLTIDFVIHDSDHGGQASRWAMHANVGDTLTIAGPGPIQDVSATADDYLFVADMTALPAAAIAIERLPSQAKGTAFIQVSHESDIQPIDAPDGIDIQWLVGSYDQSMLASSVEQLPEMSPNTAIWVACEFSQMRASRRALSAQPHFERELAYFSSYWKPGVTEDGHKKLKQEDAKSYA